MEWRGIFNNCPPRFTRRGHLYTHTHILLGENFFVQNFRPQKMTSLYPKLLLDALGG